MLFFNFYLIFGIIRYNNSTYRIDEIAWDKHPTNEFEGRNNQKIQYLKYYEDKYNKKIRDPKQPLIVSMPKVIINIMI